jgi:mannose-1-phosphate guanylyltransferase
MLDSMHSLEHSFVFIMAGGSGERFWPLSRQTTPKHLLRLFSGQTLLEQTVRRLDGLVPEDHIFILTNHAQVEATRQALPFFDPARILAEPAKRDTAPAAALATGYARARDKEAVVILLPADQVISDAGAFLRNLADAAKLAASQASLVTLAIKPSWPSTGFGYLELGSALPESTPQTALRQVVRFVEKPDAGRAQEYLKGGRHAWNAGMFLWKADTFLAEARRSCPELTGFIEQFPAGDPSPYLAEHFPALPKISVDFAIMEKAASVVCAEASFAWDDVGTWTALPAHLPQDGAGNTVRGTAALLEAGNNIVFSNGRPIALCGVSDLVVVETPDAVLVCHRDKVQDVKKLLPLLPKDIL